LPTIGVGKPVFSINSRDGQCRFDFSGDDSLSGPHEVLSAHVLSRTGAVEHARRIVLAKSHQPVTEIARVDPVDVEVRARRAQDFAAALESLDPVGESIGVIARADNVGRPHDRRFVSVDLLHDAVAFGLERAVRLAVDLFDGRVERFVQRSLVVEGLGLLEIVDGDCRRIDVTPAAALE
jgi:hypothetical protein